MSARVPPVVRRNAGISCRLHPGKRKSGVGRGLPGRVIRIWFT
jgi:hypothetical protein